jgi:hypothetical protein
LRRGDSEKRQKLGWFFPFVFTRRKDQDKARLKRGGCYEGEKQRTQGKQEGAAEDPQREEKDQEGEAEQVGWNAYKQAFVGHAGARSCNHTFHKTRAVSSIKKLVS